MNLDQRKTTLRRIALLREAEERAADPRVGEIREELEADLDGTASRSLAAGFLGVSATALNRWIDSGDIPVVHTAAGRKEVPIAALCDLAQEVARVRESGRRLHALEPAMVAARRRAESLRPDPDLLAAIASAEGDRRRISELRGLAYHRALAPQLRQVMIDRARVKLDRWERDGGIDPRRADQWRTLLDLPLGQIRAAIGVDDTRAADLRQNSPLAGLISEPERRRILELVSLGA